MPRYIAHLIGHPASISIHCGCMRVRVVKPAWLMERLGLEATIEDGEARMRCPSCKQRPKLHPVGDYAVSGGRDSRVGAEPLPAWGDLS